MYFRVYWTFDTPLTVFIYIYETKRENERKNSKMSFIKKNVVHSSSINTKNGTLNEQQENIIINSSITTDILLNDYEKLKEILQTQIFQNTFDLYQKMVGITEAPQSQDEQPPSNSSTLSSTSFLDPATITNSNSTITTTPNSLSQKITFEVEQEQNIEKIPIIMDKMHRICFETLLNELIDYKLTKTDHEWNDLLDILNNQIFRSVIQAYDQTYETMSMKKRTNSRTSSTKSIDHNEKSHSDKFCEETKSIMIVIQPTEEVKDAHDIILPPSSSSWRSQTMIIQSGDDTSKLTDQDDQKLYASKLEQYSCQKLKIIRIDKRLDEPLGCTIRADKDSILISRIIHGGVCEQDKNLFQINDEILEINFHTIRGRTVNDVVELIDRLQGQLIFLILPSTTTTTTITNEQQINPTFINDNLLKNFYIRTLFKYDPDDDPYLPCKDLGLFFCYGDILHVVNQQDENWWQAYRVGDVEIQQLAGMIPSQTFQEKRLHMIKTLLENDDDENENEIKKKHNLNIIRSCFKKLKNSQQQLNDMKQQTIEQTKK
ncbi:unnamed protein product [Didymodactylos carnosus]|uniref:PDZ domain-containing protein n=1 Tax=Didymodactylos carnosus TaxID=1234261 RepID=A0A8S2E2Y6_9BILA|nr:unnamed protein product [Didymodactylos carnosus]CAF3803363.1 unnamed protein product [Didymodactylos carnosus]